jgi:tetratricopeptide (TPR) repeat protein
VNLLRTGKHACLALVIALSCGARHAHAESSPASEAELLFRAGKSALNRGDYAEACFLLERSYQAGPATGALLALALCQERAGQLASAYYTYQRVIVRCRDEKRIDREQVAVNKLEQLRPRLSWLSIELANPVTPGGLSIKVDDASYDASQLGKALPLDSGRHHVVVEAPSEGHFESTLELPASREIQRLRVTGIGSVPEPTLAVPPVIAPEPVAEPPRSARPKPPPEPMRKAPARLSPVQWIGISASVLGAGALATSLAFAIKAHKLNERSDPNCAGNVCTIEGREDRIDARRAGDIATFTLVGGAVLVTGGVLTALLGKRSDSERRPHGQAWNVTPWTSRSGVGANVSGRF